MTRTLLVLLTGLAVLGAALPAAPQTSVDPQSLVGDWTGTWSGRVSMRGSENSGEYVLRITKVVRAITCRGQRRRRSPTNWRSSWRRQS